ncbi:NAD(P)H-hydrate dehydratase [Virgibacillus kekensis]|uniref:Bifunctional NAD(P)H-hydrate repair enzyme n=1 Tax=Virgibacillus kekensis TaxID=202261 RepID=A0ABV9DMB5_9BACI
MYIVTADEMYDIDRFTMEQVGLDGKMLMENAGRAVAERIESLGGKSDRILIVVGSGNNGGDGFVIARTLFNKGYNVEIVQIVPDKKVSGDALFHKTLFMSLGGQLAVTKDPEKIRKKVRKADIVVDAILGIGVNGMLRDPVAKIVSILNEEADRIISIDLPSGLPADEGMTEFLAVEASQTFVIEHPKISTFLQHTAPYYGEWETVPIGLSANENGVRIDRMVWGESNFRRSMPVRKMDSHKGDHGKGLIVGGNTVMPGSIAMSVKAALRTGAGLVTAGTTETVIPAVAAHCPEATYLLLGEKEIKPDANRTVSFDGFDATAVGMGMGRHDNAGKLVSRLVEDTLGPLIVDADGLHHLKPIISKVKERQHPTILTPHPGEMAMLLDTTVPELLAQPFSFSKEFAAEHQVYIVLKGQFTIITAPDGRQAVNITGNPGLAKGGSGDVLSGMILAMVMQKLSMFEALSNACFVHGKSADLLVAETHSEYDLLASDVIEGIAKVYRTFLK